MATIEIDPESELGKTLATMGEGPVVLVCDAQRYVVRRDSPDPIEVDDREAFRAALRAASGIFTPEEGERLKQNVYRWREEGTRPPDRR